MEWKKYIKKNYTEIRPYIAGEQLPSGVSVSDNDRSLGSPKLGDMIARNPKNHEDQWLVNKEYFESNYMLLEK